MIILSCMYFGCFHGNQRCVASCHYFYTWGVLQEVDVISMVRRYEGFVVFIVLWGNCTHCSMGELHLLFYKGIALIVLWGNCTHCSIRELLYSLFYVLIIRYCCTHCCMRVFLLYSLLCNDIVVVLFVL